MIEQSVVKHDDRRDRRMRKAFRIIQVVLLVLGVLAFGFGFSIAGVFWDTDRTVFWQALVSMTIMMLPVLGVAAFLEWRIRNLCVEFDYIYSENVLSIWRISGNRRSLWITVPAESIRFCKPYDNLTEDEQKKLSHVYFACCNASDPRLTLMESDCATIGKKQKPADILIEPEPDLARALKLALLRNER